jgi:hypothetical protein
MIFLSKFIDASSYFEILKKLFYFRIPVAMLQQGSVDDQSSKGTLPHELNRGTATAAG